DIRKEVGGVIVCDYCYGKNTLVKSTDINAVNFLAMGEHCLDNGKFDEAYSAFSKAASIDVNEPEAYFGMALAANKVRYIKDIKNNCLQPICYDATNKSFVSDKYYLQALSLAALEQKAEYERRAAEIDYIRTEFCKQKQAGIEYDCFICVKVTGDDGNKTIDSERANDLYFHLKDRGYKPFYSEREIQNQMIGADYEARILYALFSSPCMLIVCSDERYLQTPWVKNEYMRFINLINDEQKETDSIAIGFFNRTIERLPGRNGRLQGVCLNNPDAYSKILDFVERHQNIAAPQISRKVYGQVEYKKKAAVRSQIQKRTLAKFEQTAITASEQELLNVAKSMLDGGNFGAVVPRCDAILQKNKSCPLAYWYSFLAENRCKNSAEFAKSTQEIADFGRLESTIATADDNLRKECYDMLFNRAMADRQLYLYNEYISLPDSSPEKIKELTKAMYSALLAGEITDDPCDIFETIIKTVDDTDIYIEMNLSFADLIRSGNCETALKYYKNVVNVEESNGHALFGIFLINNRLTTIADLTAYLSFRENCDKIEKNVFAYGFNLYAVEHIFGACLKNSWLMPKYNTARLDFILSLIPQNQKQLYVACLNKMTNVLLIEDQFELAGRYNDMLIAEDNYNHMAYFKRLYIKRQTLSPFAFAENSDLLYDDPDFSAAIDAFAVKHPGEQNIYIELVNAFHRIAEDSILDVVSTLRLSEIGLNLPVSQTVNQLIPVREPVSMSKPDKVKRICEEIDATGYYEPGANSYNTVLYSILKLFVTDEQIEEGKKAYDKEYGAESFEEMRSLLSGVDTNSELEDNNYFDRHANIAFLGFKGLVNKIESREKLEEADIRLIGHFCLNIEMNSRKLSSRLLEKISEEYGSRSDIADILAAAKLNVSNVERSILLKQEKAARRLLSVYIPDSVTEIEDELFSGCVNLTEVNIGNGIKQIGRSAFEGCTALRKIEAPDSVIEIGENAFRGCDGLIEVSIGNGIKRIGKSAFEGCTALRKIEAPDSDIEIGGNAFRGCDNLTEVKGKSIQEALQKRNNAIAEAKRMAAEKAFEEAAEAARKIEEEDKRKRKAEAKRERNEKTDKFFTVIFSALPLMLTTLFIVTNILFLLNISPFSDLWLAMYIKLNKGAITFSEGRVVAGIVFAGIFAILQLVFLILIIVRKKSGKSWFRYGYYGDIDAGNVFSFVSMLVGCIVIVSLFISGVAYFSKAHRGEDFYHVDYKSGGWFSNPTYEQCLFYYEGNWFYLYNHGIKDVYVVDASRTVT
ncbi:MAG: leucine-rich repeat protein, partial [Clostridia bacterium]|nr:leucine-rich repeat protein [Clostridia bacterium]